MRKYSYSYFEGIFARIWPSYSCLEYESRIFSGHVYTPRSQSTLTPTTHPPWRHFSPPLLHNKNCLFTIWQYESIIYTLVEVSEARDCWNGLFSLSFWSCKVIKKHVVAIENVQYSSHILALPAQSNTTINQIDIIKNGVSEERFRKEVLIAENGAERKSRRETKGARVKNRSFRWLIVVFLPGKIMHSLCNWVVTIVQWFCNESRFSLRKCRRLRHGERLQLKKSGVRKQHSKFFIDEYKDKLLTFSVFKNEIRRP